MTVLGAADGPDDRRMGGVIAIDHGTHGGGRKQWSVDQRQEHRLDLGPIDHLEAGQSDDNCPASKPGLTTSRGDRPEWPTAREMTGAS